MITYSVMQPYIWQSSPGLLGALASAVIDCEPASAEALSDYVEETNQGDAAMFDLVIGKRYMFKTYGLFYVGKVVSETARCITIAAEHLVVDVGETRAAHERGVFGFSETFPKGHISRLNPIHVYVVEDMSQS